MTHRQAGFTLIEVIVGLTIIGMTMATGYGALAFMMDRHEAATSALDGHIRASQVRELLTAWVGAATLNTRAGSTAFAGLDATDYGNTPDDQLTLSTIDPVDRIPIVVTLAINRNEDTPPIGLIARVELPRDGRAEIIALEPAATGLDLQFYSPVIGGGRMLPSWVSNTLLPSAVTLTISGDSIPPLLRLPLLVTMR